MRKKWNKSSGLILGILLILSLALAGCGSQASSPETTEAEEENVILNEAFVQEIKDRGYITVGCKTDVPDLSCYDEKSKKWTGLETELAYATAAKLFDKDIEEVRNSNMVQFMGVTVADREQKLADGKIDCMMATYTITPERAKRFALSDSYYTDYVGLMVKKTNKDNNSLGDKDINTIADLDGKVIGVARKSTTRKAFLDYINTMNSQTITPIFNEYDGYDKMFKALKSGEIDVMAVDVSILNGYVDNTTKILDVRFAGQKYGVAVKKENAALLEYVNEAIAGF